MRLSQKEIDKIIFAIAIFAQNLSISLYLYGSRVHDNLKGGDIDLLLVCNGHDKLKLEDQKIAILVAIKQEIGDRKIDLTIASDAEVKSNSFLTQIMPKAVLLKKWG